MKKMFFKRGASINLARTAGLMALTYAFTNDIGAVPTEIAAVQSIGSAIMPYVKWATSIGGAAIAIINGWRVFNGQPKAGVYALGGGVVAGLGFDAMFGADVSTMLIP